MRTHRIVLVLSVITLIPIVTAALVAARAVPALLAVVREVRAAERQAREAIATWDQDRLRGIRRVESTLREAQRSLVRAREIADSLTLIRVIPPVNRALGSVERAAEAGERWLDGAAELAGIAAAGDALVGRYQDRAPSDLTDDERAELFEFLGASLARARTALAAIDAGDAMLHALRCPRTASVLYTSCSAGKPLQAPPRLRALRDQLHAIVAATDHLAAFIGAREPTTILFLFLNNTELRPGGGFLGTYGIATVHRGTLVDFRTDDVYTLDRRVEGTQRIPPPEPFRRHGIVPWWYLRDANWSPDFAASSATALDFYRREGGEGNPEVVVGFTSEVARALLDIVGPVTINGIRYTSANITDELEYQVEIAFLSQGIPRPRRKAIIEPLSRTVIARILARPFREWGPVLDAVRTAVRERHLMAFAVDPRLQGALERFDVAGDVRSVVIGTDALLVVDANLGALKTDPVVQRSIRYAIIPDGGGYRGVVRLRYRNTGTFTWKTTRYRTYTRVYLPSGSELVGVQGAMVRDRSDEPGPVDEGTEFDRKVVGAFLSVEPGAERSLAFEFRLAPSVVRRIRSGSYALAVPKQLGSIATPLTLDLEFGTPVKAADPPEPPAAWGNSSYTVETDLREDRAFSVQLDRR